MKIYHSNSKGLEQKVAELNEKLKGAESELKAARDERNSLEQSIKTLSSEIYKLRTASPVHEELIAEQERSEGLEETIDKIIHENDEKQKDTEIEIKSLQDEVSRLNSHNLMLVEALKSVLDRKRDHHYTENNICGVVCGLCDDDFRVILTSPASKKYLAMLKVVEAANDWGYTDEDTKDGDQAELKLMNAIVDYRKLKETEAYDAGD